MRFSFLYDSPLDESQISTSDESRARHESDWGTDEEDASHLTPSSGQSQRLTLQQYYPRRIPVAFQ